MINIIDVFINKQTDIDEVIVMSKNEICHYF
jgi:hypothetical protein